MTISKLQAHIEKIEKNALLYEEKNFEKRIEAIEFIEFKVLDQMEDLFEKTAHPKKLSQIKFRAEKVRAELNKVNNLLFQKLRSRIKTEGFAGEQFKNLVREYICFNLYDFEHPVEIAYENLDILINGLSYCFTIPQQTKELEPEMIFYQKTPARIVFDLVDKAHFVEKDIFFDLGSGLGQVAILVNLLSGVTARGIEFEPAFCDYANNCAQGLNLPNVTFIPGDARKADFSEGTVFFMFTPFKGQVLQQVLDLLGKVSKQRKIKIITYGPCSAQVALQDWLNVDVPWVNNIYGLSIFNAGKD